MPIAGAVLVKSLGTTVGVSLQCLLNSVYCRYNADEIAWHDYEGLRIVPVE